MHLEILLLAVVLVSLVIAEPEPEPYGNKARKFKNAKVENKKLFLEWEKKLSTLQRESFEEEEENLEEEEEEYEYEGEEEEGLVYQPTEENDEDPCEDLKCEERPGRECVINDSGEPECVCAEDCTEVDDDNRRKVCSNHNETWSSDCSLHRMRCFCEEKNEQCEQDKYNHMHIDYYGECQQVGDCEENEMADFPRRMREWLFNIMRDMADREELNEHFKVMELEAENNEDAKRWSNAAVWKFCNLDDHPRDRSVSRHEMFPLRAPLYTLEHCISPFLDSCDPNDDHQISLEEWVHCLELSEEHVQDLEDLCGDIREE